MNLVIWVLKEINNISMQLLTYIGYYRLRDRLPFFTLLLYRADKAKHRKIYDDIAQLFISMALAIAIVSAYLWATGGGKSTLTGFNWPYIAPIEYGLQIAIIYTLARRFTKHITYSTALAYHAAAATGWVYEIPFFIYSLNPETTIIRVNGNNIFLLSYQIIACIIYLMLLCEKGVQFNRQDLGYFAAAYLATFFQAWQGSWVLLRGLATTFARVPMILFSIYLVVKLGDLNRGAWFIGRDWEK